jgi:chaperonin cofactor prefoldin
MRFRTLLVTLTVGVVLAGGAGAALAGAGQPSVQPDLAAACERAGHRLDHLQKLAERLTNRIARIEQRLAGGELTDQQQKRAEKRLARLERLLGKLEQRTDRLSAAIAEHCASGSAA